MGSFDLKSQASTSNDERPPIPSSTHHISSSLTGVTKNHKYVPPICLLFTPSIAQVPLWVILTLNRYPIELYAEHVESLIKCVLDFQSRGQEAPRRVKIHSDMYPWYPSGYVQTQFVWNIENVLQAIDRFGMRKKKIRLECSRRLDTGDSSSGDENWSNTSRFCHPYETRFL